MKIHTIEKDKLTKKFIKELGGTEVQSNIFRIPGGGTLLVGAWSVSPEEMPKSKMKKWSLKLSKKGLNIPLELQDCNVYMVLNNAQFFNLSYECVNILGNLNRVTRPQIPKHLRDRGGGVAYWHLHGDRVITPSKTEATGATKVCYGTSALSNIAELIQTMKVAAHLNLPCVFDCYPTAYNVGNTVSRFRKSLQGTEINIPEWVPESLWEKKSYQITANTEKFLPHGLPYLEGTLDYQYIQIQKIIAEILKKVLELDIKVTIVRAEEGTLLMKDKIGSLAGRVRRAANHSVRLLYEPTGNPISTEAAYPYNHKTLKQMHEMGYWASGALIYYSVYYLGGRNGTVNLIYDGAKGGIHLQAREWMEDPYKLWVAPVGSFGIHPQGFDTPIDPFVFLMLLNKWGNDKTEEILQKIWDACEAPLDWRSVGTKTKVNLSLDGLSIEVQKP